MLQVVSWMIRNVGPMNSSARRDTASKRPTVVTVKSTAGERFIHLFNWKLSPVVFYHRLELRNTTWLSFQPNTSWKLSPVVFYRWLRLRNTTWLSFQPNTSWKLSSVVLYHWLRLRNTTWLSFQPDIIIKLLWKWQNTALYLQKKNGLGRLIWV